MKPVVQGSDCVRLSSCPPDTAPPRDSGFAAACPILWECTGALLPGLHSPRQGWGPRACCGASPAGPSAPPGTWPCSSCWGSCRGSRSTAPRLSPAPPCRGACLQRWMQQAPSGEPAPTARGREETPQEGPQDGHYSINSSSERPGLLGLFSGKGLAPSQEPFWTQRQEWPPQGLARQASLQHTVVSTSC